MELLLINTPNRINPCTFPPYACLSLMKYLKDRDFGKMRQWVVENIDADPVRIFRTIYDNMHDYLEPSSIPQIVLLIGEYQYKQAFVQDREINLVAFLTEVMVEAEWK